MANEDAVQEGPGLGCPTCWCRRNHVTHTWTQEYNIANGGIGTRIRRRRVCENHLCGRPYFTLEYTEEVPEPTPKEPVKKPKKAPPAPGVNPFKPKVDIMEVPPDLLS